MLLPSSHLIMSFPELLSKCPSGNDYTILHNDTVYVRHVTVSVANQSLVPRVYMTSLRYVGDREEQRAQHKDPAFSFWLSSQCLGLAVRWEACACSFWGKDQEISAQVKFLYLSFSIAYWGQNTHVHTKCKIKVQTETLCTSVTCTQLMQRLCGPGVFYMSGAIVWAVWRADRECGIVGWLNNPVFTGHRRVGF